MNEYFTMKGMKLVKDNMKNWRKNDIGLFVGTSLVFAFGSSGVRLFQRESYPAILVEVALKALLFVSASILISQIRKHIKAKRSVSLAKYLDEQLHDMLVGQNYYYPEGCPPQHMLEELQVRGKDIGQYLEMILDLHVSKDRYYQKLAFEAMVNVYPEEFRFFEECKWYRAGTDLEKEELLPKVKDKLELSNKV